jgi:Xaa-Pro aminopeptidase
VVGEPWEGGDFVRSLIDELQAWGVTAGRVGCELDTLPLPWFLRLRDLLPDVEWVDAAAALRGLWSSRSEEETESVVNAARIADLGFDHILSITEPGMSEIDVVSEFNNSTSRRGAGRNFTLIASGRLTGDSRHSFGELGLATRRPLESGDTVLLEMSPAVKGYWAQLVRAYTLGESSETTVGLHRACVAALAATAPVLSPGAALGDAAATLWDAAKREGYVPIYPCGHVVGPDLTVERMLTTSERVLCENDTVIVHPRLRTPDGRAALLWGETYRVTADGGVPLTSSGTRLRVI